MADEMSEKPVEWGKKTDGVKVRDVEPENWIWEVHYTDGTIIKQFDDKFEYHEFGEIDTSKLDYLLLRPFDRCNIPGLIDRSNPGIRIELLGYSAVQSYFDMVLENGEKARVCCLELTSIASKIVIAVLPDNTIIITDDVKKLVMR
jgi:hypothetical protein